MQNLTRRGSTESRGNGHATTQLARGLGWFSVGLGLAEVAAPETLARLIGVEPDRRTRETLVAMGLREIANGVGILSRPQKPGLVWSRVLGDLLDLSLLGVAMRSKRQSTQRLAFAVGAVVGVTALDAFTGRRLAKQTATTTQRVTRAITIRRPVPEVYALLRNLEQYPRFMTHVGSAKVGADGRARWTMNLPVHAMEWDVEVVDEQPGMALTWRTVAGSLIDVRTMISLRAAPGGRGTEVQMTMGYDIPGGRVTAAIASLFGKDPGTQVARDLRRLKQLLELGEITQSDASIHVRPHPARPSQKGLEQ